MSDQDADDEAAHDEIADLEAVEDKFKPEDFAEVAEALDLPAKPEILAWLRDLLLPEFRFFIESCPGEELSRDERIDRARKLRDTARALDTLLGPGGARSGLSWRFWGLITDQFTDTLRGLAHQADRQIQRLRSSPPGQAGRPPKGAFRQLGAGLIRIFEKMTRKRAKDLDFDEFGRFAAAACHCLRVRVPEADRAFPVSPRALRDGLLKTWNSVVKTQSEKPLPL
jgi:hypothetical protein